MDKLIFVICLLAALSSIPSEPDTRMDWEVALHAGRRCVTGLRIEFSGPYEWRIMLRCQILTLDYEARECLPHWRPGHA
jgi:hypothetical protein